MGRVTNVLLVSLAAVVATSVLVVFVTGDNVDTGVVSDPVAKATSDDTSSESSIPSTSEDYQVGYTPLPPDTVRIWDTMGYDSHKHYGFEAWNRRSTWVLVPPGETDYEFQGDPALEGHNFWISLHSSPYDAVFLYAKLEASGTPARHNEIYRAWNTPNGYCNYGSGSQSCRILKYEEGELLIESEAITYTDHGFETTVTTNYRIVGGQWLVQITPVSQASQQGMHGETRIFIAPEVGTGGNDWTVDSTKYPDTYHAVAPTNSKTTLDLAMDIDTIYVMTWPTPSKARPSANCAYGGWYSGWQLIGEGSTPPVWTAPFANYGDAIEPVYIGVMPHGFWKYQKVDQTVTAGQVVTGNWVRVYSRTITGSPWTPGGPWVPMYPGKWRLTGCINGQYYTQEVIVTEEDTSSTAFSFTAPVAGTLEYLTFYLYERTDQTPLNVRTVMDIYHRAIQPVAEPVGRHVFYNNSSFDGNNPAAGAADDNAIATDKTALLPGLTAAFANYTSYNRGINGIMVDIPNLPTIPEITASDFTFKVGNPPPAQILWSANFDIGTDSFSYVDDTFRGTSNPTYADGDRIASGGHSGGALRVTVGNVDDVDIINGMSGGWSRSFTLAAESTVSLSLWYKLTQSGSYEPDEYSEALVSIDGQLIGTDGDRLAIITGDGESGDPITTGWVHAEISLGTLSAGSHTLRIGAYNNQKTFNTEVTDMLIDDVQVSYNPPPPAQTVLDVNFDSGTDGFGYADDTFRSTNSPAYADGERIASGGHSGGALRVAMGGIDMVSVNGMSGGWGRSFTLAAESNVSLSLWYNLTQTNAYEPDEYSDAMVSVDGQLFGTDGNDYVVRITGDGEYGDPITTGWVHAEVSLGVLSAGSHTLRIGAYNNKKDHYLEATEMIIDDVKIATVPPPYWADAAAPTSVTVRRGAGVGGSDRVTVIWADGDIQKQWLQVTVKANLATLLASPDVFYFGNAVGDSGNSTTDTAVNTMDEMRARLDPHKSLLNPADIENPHDYNRSGVVSTMDEMIARLNNTTMLNDLNLITAP